MRASLRCERWSSTRHGTGGGSGGNSRTLQPDDASQQGRSGGDPPGSRSGAELIPRPGNPGHGSANPKRPYGCNRRAGTGPKGRAPRSRSCSGSNGYSGPLPRSAAPTLSPARRESGRARTRVLRRQSAHPTLSGERERPSANPPSAPSANPRLVPTLSPPHTVWGERAAEREPAFRPSIRVGVTPHRYGPGNGDGYVD